VLVIGAGARALMHACGDEVRAGRLAGDEAVGILQSTIRSVFLA
jgi:hypothetical protein